MAYVNIRIFFPWSSFIIHLSWFAFLSNSCEFTSLPSESPNLPGTWMSRSTWPSQAANAEPSPELSEAATALPVSACTLKDESEERGKKEQGQDQATRPPLPAQLSSYLALITVLYVRGTPTGLEPSSHPERHINSTQVVLKSPSWSFNLYTVSSVHFAAAISVPLTYRSLTRAVPGPSSDVKVTF